MAGYTVEVLTIDGKWAPKDAQHRLQSLASAALDTFAARLENVRSRIREWPSGAVIAEVRPKAVHVSMQDVYRTLPAIRKLLAT